MYLLSPKEREALKKYLGCKNQRGVQEDILWKKVKRYQKIFSYIPGVQTICICNSLAMNSCHTGSDIDLFVITGKNRLWTARIYLTLITLLSNSRKTKNKHAGRFCLSFFISIDEGNFYDIAIQQDIYLNYWIETLSPIINKNQSYEVFLQKNNISPHSQTSTIQEDKNTNNYFGKLIIYLGDIQEYILKKIFLTKTLRTYKKLGNPFGVIIRDTMLKFHDKDKRIKIRDTVLGKIEE